MKAVFMTLIMAMTPIVELRGAIPYGVVSGLSVKEALIISIIGNIIPIPFLILFTRKVFEWLMTRSRFLDNMVTKLKAKADAKKDIVEKYEFFGLMLLVAIPLPGTGGWTGALVAAMMDMRLKRAMPSIILGIIFAGVIVSWITYGASVIF